MLKKPGKLGHKLLSKWFLVAAMGFGGVQLTAQSFGDLFATRETLSGTGGLLAGETTSATREHDEPRHAGKPGGHSVWISWIAPENGLARFEIIESDFDTLLAVYREEGDHGDTSIDDLKRVADNDDSDSHRSSAVVFPTRAGQRYEIAVDGYAGAAGSFVLEWGLFGPGFSLPIIANATGDQSLQLGETLTLSIDLEEIEDLECRWYFNDEEVDGGEEPTLVIPNLQERQVGRYRLRIKVKDMSFFSDPIEIQINSEGMVSVLARDKPLDALASGFATGSAAATPAWATLAVVPWVRVPAPLGSVPGVVRGYSGTQIFNTSYAFRDPAEPMHCGVGGGASDWFAYRPPEDGLLTLDTRGSDFDTVVAVYSYDPPLLGYESLQEWACDDNGAGAGSASRVQFPAKSNRDYFVVVDGVGGAKGIAHLNYELEPHTGNAAEPAITADASLPDTVVIGADVTFDVLATGMEPLSFQWFKDSQTLTGATNAMLQLTNVQAGDSGQYSVVVTNRLGSSSSVLSDLRVLNPPQLEARIDAAHVVFSLSSIPGVHYTLERANAPQSHQWIPLGPPIVAQADRLELTNLARPKSIQFYRLRADGPPHE